MEQRRDRRSERAASKLTEREERLLERRGVRYGHTNITRIESFLDT